MAATTPTIPKVIRTSASVKAFFISYNLYTKFSTIFYKVH